MLKLLKLFVVLVGCLMLALLGISAPDSDILLYVTGPCHLKFPEDHGPHPCYRTEWWYYTGNVSDKDGVKFGFQLTFFRSRIGDESMDTSKGSNEVSPWRTQQLILSHAALTEISEKKHHKAEQMARQTMGIADAFQKNDRTHVFLRNWSLDIMPQAHIIEADSQDFSFEFTLVPMKKPVLHGDQGYSRKGRQVESASCYYSFTRLKAQGKIRVGSEIFEVDGFAWMDHEFSTNPLEPDLVGWDWFSIQLDNYTELMAYFLRKKDGTFSNASSATFVTVTGDSKHLTREDMHLKPIKTWKSNQTGGIYPSQWHLKIPQQKLELVIISIVADQEMQTPETTGVTYWEGSVSVEGFLDGKAVSGKGYAELTGYVEPLDVPM
jgi:predicted secreted hydrolase